MIGFAHFAESGKMNLNRCRNKVNKKNLLFCCVFKNKIITLQIE